MDSTIGAPGEALASRHYVEERRLSGAVRDRQRDICRSRIQGHRPRGTGHAARTWPAGSRNGRRDPSRLVELRVGRRRVTRQHVAPAEFGELFAMVRRSSWRWECQRSYAVDGDELQAWKAGRRLPESEEDRAWEAYIRGLRKRGIPFERVRVFHAPPTDYQRWIHSTTARNLRIGEDVRWLAESRVHDLEMPQDDFYLIDDVRVAVLRFDGFGEMTGVVIDDDPGVVSLHRTWRDRAWAVAIPHHLYDPAHGER